MGKSPGRGHSGGVPYRAPALSGGRRAPQGGDRGIGTLPGVELAARQCPGSAGRTGAPLETRPWTVGRPGGGRSGSSGRRPLQVPDHPDPAIGTGQDPADAPVKGIQRPPGAAQPGLLEPHIDVGIALSPRLAPRISPRPRRYSLRTSPWYRMDSVLCAKRSKYPAVYSPGIADGRTAWRTGWRFGF